MTEKRFTMIYFETDGNLIFDESKHDGEWYDSTECLQDNEIVELLNELHEENQALKKQLQSEHTMLDNAILLERTRMGQSALKQYKEAIQ